MPAADVVLDSNVLLYALSNAPDERRKRERAVALLASENFGVSFEMQVYDGVKVVHPFLSLG